MINIAFPSLINTIALVNKQLYFAFFALRFVGLCKNTILTIFLLLFANNPLIAQAETEEEYLKQYILAKEINDLQKTAILSAQLGSYYFQQQRFTKAIDWFNKAIQGEAYLNNIPLHGEWLKNYGISLYRNGEFVSSKSILQKALQVAKKNGDGVLASQIIVNQAGVDFALKDFEEATKNLKNYQAIRDSIYNHDLTSQLQELMKLYSLQKQSDEAQQLRLSEQQRDIERYRQKMIILIATGLLLVFMILATAYLIRRNHLHRISLRREEEKQEQLRLKTGLEAEYNERCRIGRDLHDELGGGLSRILLALELAKEKYDDKELLAFLAVINASTRKLHENMNSLIWLLNPGEETLEILFYQMREYALGFFEGTQIECRIDFPDQTNRLTLHKDAFRNIFLAFKEVLNNILKHAFASDVDISVKLEDDRIEILIEDNGNGFDISEEINHGHGLLNITGRLKNAGGKAHIQSIRGKGTKVFLHATVENHISIGTPV